MKNGAWLMAFLCLTAFSVPAQAFYDVSDYVIQVKQDEPESVPMTWDLLPETDRRVYPHAADIRNVVLEDLPTEIVQYGETNEIPFNHVWLWADYGDNISLYELNDGRVWLRRGSEVAEFDDWAYRNLWRNYPPRMKLADYDGDGVEELAVVLYRTSGTGLFQEELHVVDFANDGTMTSHRFPDRQMCEELSRAYTFRADQASNSLDLTLGNKTYTVPWENWQKYQAKALIPLIPGNYLIYELENNQIWMKQEAQVGVEFSAVPVGAAGLNTDVRYSDGKFSIGDSHFVAKLIW